LLDTSRTPKHKLLGRKCFIEPVNYFKQMISP